MLNWLVGELRLIIIIIANYKGLRLLVIISNFWSNTVITWFTLFLPVMAGTWDRNLELHSLYVFIMIRPSRRFMVLI